MTEKQSGSSLGGVLLGVGVGLLTGAVAGWLLKLIVKRYRERQAELLHEGAEGLDMTTVIGESPGVYGENLERHEEPLGTLAGGAQRITQEYQDTVEELESKIFRYEEDEESFPLPNIQEDTLYEAHPPGEEEAAEEESA